MGALLGNLVGGVLINANVDDWSSPIRISFMVGVPGLGAFIWRRFRLFIGTSSISDELVDSSDIELVNSCDLDLVDSFCSNSSEAEGLEALARGAGDWVFGAIVDLGVRPTQLLHCLSIWAFN